MGWVVDGVVRRIRRKHGICVADDWEEFVTRRGMKVTRETLPIDGMRAFTVDNLIVLNTNQGFWDEAHAGLEEYGHRQMHAGDRDWWRSRPQGDITVAKFERQAREFASRFPVTGDDDDPFFAHPFA